MHEGVRAVCVGRWEEAGLIILKTFQVAIIKKTLVYTYRENVLD